MKTVTFYDADTGRILGTFRGSLEQIVDHTPVGAGVYEGELDANRQIVNVNTGKPIAWRPPRPDPHAIWREDFGRWFTREDLNRKHTNKLAQLEAQQQRAQRELLLEIAKKVGVDATRLQAIDDEAAAARTRLIPSGE